MKRKIYCISGLGADERLFKNLQLPGAELVYLNWMSYHTTESVVAYAKKMSVQVEEPNPVLMGVSFGGMLAVEMAKQLQATQVFLISSARSGSDFPFPYHLAGFFKLTHLIPGVLIKSPTKLIDYLFGVQSTTDRELLHDYLHNADPHYIRWALQRILEWKNKDTSINIVQIHGTNDKVIPIPSNVNYRLQQAGHLMVFNRAKEVSEIISKNLVI